MTHAEWFAYAQLNKEKLNSVISIYHPINHYKDRRDKSLPITAMNAQAACDDVSESIRKNSEGDPVKDFNEAISKMDLNMANKILAQTWFGVPESTSCWGIEGFKELVILSEELPQ